MNNVMLIGLPISGKSDMSTILKQHGYTIIDLSRIRHTLQRTNVPINWETIWQIIEHEAQAAYTPIVYDATNLYKERRMAMLTAFQEIGITGWEAVAFALTKNVTKLHRLTIFRLR